MSPARDGEDDRQGRPTTRQDLILVSPPHVEKLLATVEYPVEGYPAKLILGEEEPLLLSIRSEEELIEELARHIASLGADI